MSSNHSSSSSLTPCLYSSVCDSVRESPSDLASYNLVLLGESAAVRRLRSQIQRIAPYFRVALVRGEAGTGKQLVARAIHGLSTAAEGPFVIADAALLAKSIADPGSSQLQPTKSVDSLLQTAQGGTLYLDGVGALPYPLQSGLLQFLNISEERRPQHLTGSNSLRNYASPHPGPPDIRILAGSHLDLRVLSAIGQFRSDLYARLSAVEIFVPPLSQRTEDIPELAAGLLRRYAERTGQATKSLSTVAAAHLRNHPWPGNLSDLNRLVTQAAAQAEGTWIELQHLLSPDAPPALRDSGQIVPHSPVQTPKIARLQDVIQQHVLDVLNRCGGNKLRAAELLGISRSTLYRMLDAASGLTIEPGNK
jgi:DNA-binding NtrC family response regulator